MRIYSAAVFSLFLFQTIGCSHSPSSQTSPGLDRPPGAFISSAPFYDEALQFDQLLQGRSDLKTLERLRGTCKSPSTNPFCPSIQRFQYLEKIRLSRTTTRSATIIKPIIPVNVVWKKNTITNWNTLRRAQVQGLIKGLLAADSRELHALIKTSIQEKRCPNNMAIAIAATLEDLLPDHAQTGRIAELYQIGARCARREPVDREHFLTRAALLYLLAKQTKNAEQILSKVVPTDAFSGRALYWLYRTRLELGDGEGSSQAFHRLTLKHPFSFHALHALKGVGQDPGSTVLEKRDILKNRSEKDQKLNQYLYQAELLNSHNFESSAAILVQWLLEQRGMEPGVRLYLASLGDAAIRVTTGTEFLYRRSSLLTQSTMELLFPKPYFSLFDDASSRHVSPYLGLAVARKESVFNPKAVSVANAQGLLQLNPETALRLMDGKSHDLMEPRTNIELGMRYLNELMKRYSGNLLHVLAAYNAGEDVVGIWQKRFPSIEPLLWLDLIPYRETRDYVGFVLANYFWYRRLYASKDEVPSLF